MTGSHEPPKDHFAPIWQGLPQWPYVQQELLAAQREPENYQSLRVRMGGWCAYFTMLSREQQDHHIRRQEGRS